MGSLITSPLWLLGVLLVGGVTLAAMSGPFLVRKRWALEQLKSNNEVAGFKFATVGVIYAVLLAFAVVVVWEAFSEADQRVAAEAGAAVTVYRLADGIGGGSGAELHEAITHYLEVAVADDWAAMEYGRAGAATTDALDAVYATVLRYQPADLRNQVLMAEVLYQLDQITEARRERIVLSRGIVPWVVWVVLFAGAFITLGFTLFFGTENLRAQALMTGALSMLVLSGLLVIIAIDRPFSGTVKVRPEALVEVLKDLGHAARTG